MISAIHNYCDSWCERCAFTGQCAVYAKTSNLSEEEKDINNPKFWEFVGNQLTEALSMLQTKMEEMGIPPMTKEEEAECEAQHKQTEFRANEHPLLKLSKEYASDIDGLLKYISEKEAGRKAENTERMEVILWYQYFIQVKLHRALSGLFDNDDEEVDEYAMYDANGSAKIALLATERSLTAWYNLYEVFPEKEDEILKSLILLKKIIELIKSVFPNAESFIRPGFDENKSQVNNYG